MPNREIKESCRSSPTLNILSDFAERLFWRLTTVADDFGRFPADARYLKSECFPLRDDMKTARVRSGFAELTTAGLVIEYQHGDRTYGQFKTWEKHQRRRALHSKYPAPSSAVICQQPPSDASDLRSTIYDQDPKDRSTIYERASRAKAPADRNGYSPGFELLWSVSPDRAKVGKGKAYDSWVKEKLEPRAQEIADAMAGIVAMDAWRRDANGKPCIPNLATWINQARYDDGGGLGALTLAQLYHAKRNPMPEAVMDRVEKRLVALEKDKSYIQEKA